MTNRQHLWWFYFALVAAFVGGLFGTAYHLGKTKPAALANQPSTLAERGVEMKPGYRVELHRLPNGVPCAILTGGPDHAAITCGWDAKPVRKP